MSKVQTIKTACRNCHGGCGALVTVEDGVATKIAPNPASPLSRGRMCPKGASGLELLYHPDRINYPMKRAGERGEGKWERITWDEAYDIIAEKLLAIEAEYGMESVAVAQGTGRHHLNYVVRFANSIGTPNWFEPGTAQCFFPRVNITKSMFGFSPVVDYYSEVNPECILVWGANPAVSGADCESQFRFKDAVRKGARVIVIDPKRNEVAEHAELFLQVRPGTDDALALGMLNVIISENLHDREFVEKYCHGFERLAERVREYPVARVSRITGVEPGLIIKAARLFALSATATVEWGCAIEHTPNCVQTVRAIACLPAITGNIDKKGTFIEGMHLLPDPDVRVEALGEHKRRIRMGAEEYKVLAGEQNDFASAHIPTVFEAMRTGRPYPIKALMLCGNNGLNGFADSKTTYETFKKLDFICSQELFMTPTTRMADIVLPAACWLEVDAVYSGPTFADHAILAQRAVVEPLYERKQDEVIFIELCKRMGKDYGADTLDEILDGQLEHVRQNYPQHAGLTLEKLRELGHVTVPIEYERQERRGAKGGKPFDTNTGKIELFSTMLDEMGYDGLPYYEEPPESPLSQPELYKEYPIILNTGTRSPYFFISENRQMPSLRRSNPFPITQVHPATAAAYGIADGDWMYIESPRGKITQKAQVTDAVRPGSVNCQMGWWFPERKNDPTYGLFEVNCNVLTSMKPPYDPAMGTYQLRALLCRISKNADGARFERDYLEWMGVGTRPIEDSSNCTVINPDKCVGCGNCVNVCANVQGVGALEMVTTQHGTYAAPVGGRQLVHTNCVGCGQCAKACPTGAIRPMSKLGRVLMAINRADTVVVAQIAPSVRVGMSKQLGMKTGENTLGRVINLLRRIGFDRVYDTSLSADLTIIAEANELVERLSHRENLPLLTSCCPAWVKFCEEQFPEFASCISTCRSPHQMLGAILKRDFASNPEGEGKRLFIVSIMPCTAKKDEILRGESQTGGVQDVDCVLTTAELAEFVQILQLDVTNLDDDCADAPYSLETGSGVIFGASGGVMESALRYLTRDRAELRDGLKDSGTRGDEGIRELSLELGGRTVRAAVTSGLKNARRLMERVRAGEADYDVIEVMACPGGCIMGGGQPPHDYYLAHHGIHQNLKRGLYTTDEKTPVTESAGNPQALELMESMTVEEQHRLLHRNKFAVR